MINTKLLKVSKPVRYIGGELNSVIKDNDGLLNFCLIFPDIYEVALSNVGYRLLYSLVNKSEEVYCQRFFAPVYDALKVFGKDIFVSLEKKKPLREFDILGFSINYEMSYPTILTILNYSNISRYTKDRKEDEPIIIAGGTCTYNPAPILNYIDAFYIGEGDKGLRQLLEFIKSLKDKGYSRKEILEYINIEYDYIYVPVLNKDKIVKRCIYNDFSNKCENITPVVPLMEVVQDRVAVEIARGCTAGCRFCQAGMIYRPVREREVSVIYKDVLHQLESTGYQEVSLLSLSTGDYSQIEPLIIELNRKLENMKVSLSTPSLRADSVSETLFKEISKVRKSGFTIAPEAGSQRMRRVINKNLTEEDILKAVSLALDNGYSSVKLYFMIGLPFETDEDILAIADLATSIKRLVKSNKRGFDISISVSHFVPKPHTPFQRFGQVPKVELERRMYLLKDELKSRRFKVKFHDTRVSTIEAVLSRGDQELGRLLEYVSDNGFYLENWNGEGFNYENWKSAGNKVGLDIESYASRSYKNKDKTPWWNIFVGVSDLFYEKEIEKALKELETGNCRKGNCFGCGICDFESLKTVNASEPYSNNLFLNNNNNIKDEVYTKYILTYEKVNEAKYLSVLELSRLITHSLILSNIHVKYTQGFNPIPKLVLYLPLSVGIEGIAEKLIFEASKVDIDSFIDKFNSNLPKGLKGKEIQIIDKIKTGADYISSYKLKGDTLLEIKKAYNEKDCFYQRMSKKNILKQINLSDYLIDFNNDIITISSNNNGSFNLVELLKKRNFPYEKAEIVRISVELL